MRALPDTTELEGCGEAEATNGESGQGLVEYAMILMVVALVVVGVLTALGTSVGGMLQDVGSAFP